MSGREAILAAIRANKPAPRPLPDVPAFPREGEPLARFLDAFTAMGGKVAEGDDPLASVRQRLAGAGRTVSRVPEIAGDALDLDASPASLDDVDVGVVRAAFAIAETGSLLLTEAEFGINTLGYLAQHLVVLLDPADMVGDMHEAYARPEWREARYAVLHTGPSATADIEGVLIHGAQGVRSLTLVLLPRS